MVIPLPGVGIQGVPTEYALKSRSLFWGFAFMMFVSAIVKFITLNIIGGFMMLILGAVGFYALRDNSMDMGCVMTWGMICLINGIFEFVFLIDRAVKGPYAYFSLVVPQPVKYNILNLLDLCGGAGEFLVAIWAYKVYRNATDEFEMEEDALLNHQNRPMGVDYGGGAGGGARDFGGGEVGAGQNGAAPAAAGAQGQQRQSFRAFEGTGNTLGAE